MAKLPSIQTIQSGFNSQETINSNFLALQQAFSNTLSRDGSVPNFMSADLDLNGNNLLNVSAIFVDGVDLVATLTDYLTQALDAKESAQTDAVSAANSATSAATSAVNAAVSENNSAASATSAATSSASAATSATNSATSATNAATSETNALAYANDALVSKTSCINSETNAAASAAQAGGFASDAATHAASASASADQALAALDSFDDRYLGQKASDPTLDNDGNPLVAGALYFNTTDNVMKVYEGSLWVAAYASLSGALLAANNLSDLLNVGTARNNLDLGLTDNVGFGSVTTTGRIIAGSGSGGVALTHNDGQGNANVTFNHVAGVPEQNGNAARIDVNTDSTSNAAMNIGLGSNVTDGVSADLIRAARFTDTQQILYHSGNVRLSTTSYGGNVEGRLTISDRLDATGNVSSDADVIAGNVVSALGGSSTDWNTAYSWGDHSVVGYLTDITGESIQDLSDVNTSMVPTDGQVLVYDTTNGWQAEDLVIIEEMVSNGSIATNTVDLVFTDLDFLNYDYYLNFRNAKPRFDNTALVCQISSDNGVTYETASSTYSWGQNRVNNGTNATAGDNGDNKIVIGWQVGRNGAIEWGITSEIVMSQTSLGSFALNHQTTYRDYTGDNIAIAGSGVRRGNVLVNAVRFFYNGGEYLHGEYTLTRKRKA